MPQVITDVITYNTPISACMKAQQWHQALSLCPEVLYGCQLLSPPLLQSVLAEATTISK